MSGDNSSLHNSDLEKTNTALREALQQARQAREELDKRVFHLGTLSDLHSELSPIIQFEPIIEKYLLVTMGALGISRGFALVYDREAKRVRTAVRGPGVVKHEALSAADAEKLLYKSFEVSEDRSLAPMSVTCIADAHRVFADLVPGLDARVGFLFVVSRTCLGVVGFGPSITGADLSGGEKELLRSHTAGLTVYLKNAMSFESIEALNRDLIQRNEELRKTIADLTEARNTIAILERARVRIRSLIQGEMKRVDRANPYDLALILLLATILAVLFNTVSPQGISLLPETLFRKPSAMMDATETRALLDAGEAVLVDARPKELYGQRHIKGSINIPSALFDIIYLMKLGNPGEPKKIIVYGRTISKLHDEEVAHRLKQRDHENVWVLTGGLHAWESHGYPVE